MVSEQEAKKLRDKIFRVRTEEEIDQMLEETFKEMDDHNTKCLTHEESIAHVRRMINESKKLQIMGHRFFYLNSKFLFLAIR